MATQTELMWEYEDWCAERGLSSEGSAATYLDASVYIISAEDRAWLKDFLMRWNATHSA